MRMGEYFIGKKIVLNSLLPRAEVQRRINAASGSMFWPFGFYRVVGGARLGFVRLRYQSHPFEYNAKPIVSGRIYEHLGGTKIRAKFGGPVWVKVFFVVWYSLLSLMAFGIAMNPSGIEPVGETIILIVFPFFFLAPLIMHFVFTRDSDEDLGRILEFLEHEAEAKSAS